MYKHGYYKYKTKYINVKEQSYTLDNVDEEFVQDDIISESFSDHDDNHPYDVINPELDTKEDIDSVHIFDTPTSINSSNSSNSNSSNSTNYVSKFGPSNTPESLVRGKPVLESELDEDNFVSFNNNNDNKNKILKIDTLDDFDNFTEMYGFIFDVKDHDNDQTIGIKWDKVSDKYKGLFINKGLEADRLDNVFFNQQSLPSWWSNDFQFDNIVIFV
jgi:hypothetical protein